MASVFSSMRRRLDALPMWAVAILPAGALGLWMLDFRIPDPMPYMDRIFLGGVFLATGIYVWRRFFGPPGAISSEARRKVAQIENLFEEAKKAAAAVPGTEEEVIRLGELLEKVRAIEARLEQTEIVLMSPEYDSKAAAAEVERLTRAAAAASGTSQSNLRGALDEATKHAANIAHIVGTRDELSSAFERIYQLVRRIHSQIVGVGLTQGTDRDVASSVDELARTVEEYEKEQAALERASELADKEIEEAQKKAASTRRDVH